MMRRRLLPQWIKQGSQRAAATAAEAVMETATDISSASAQLAASTGLSEEAAEKYQAVMEEIRGANYGESYQDVADVMAETIQIMGELDSADMTGVVEGAITLRDTFDMDVNETLRAVDVMMQTMGVDATEAFDLIAKGAQNGLNRSGELTDNITEYGQLWAQAGFSAEEMFSIMENGLDAGAYNLDKVNDYVKEFGNSLADGRVEDHLDSFSTESQQLFEQWKNGEASTKDVFYSIIDDLSKMENQQEALTIASDVWSALGEDNSLKVLTALDDVNEGYENVKGTIKKPRKSPSWSKRMMIVMYAICIEIVVYAEIVMWVKYDLSALYALIGVPAAMFGTFWAYAEKSKAENTKGGITYDTAIRPEESPAAPIEPEPEPINQQTDNDDIVG